VNAAPAIRHPGERRWETHLLAMVTLMLTAVGVAACYSSATYFAVWYHEATQQAVAAVAGGVLFVAAAYIDYDVWRRLARPLLLATVAGLVPIAIVAALWQHRKAPGPIDEVIPYISGAHRWLRFGIQIQVSEIARFTLAAYLATRAAELGRGLREFRSGFAPLIGVMAVVIGLVAIEPSVSMAVVLGVIGITVIFTAGARISHLFLVGLLAAAALAAVLVLNPMRAQRTEDFLNSSIECSPQVQSCQSLIGLGNGGVFGVGFGRGTQKLGHQPDAYSDFLLSVIGEEWGFAGVALIGIAFGVFCWVGYRIARTARDPFGTYLASGLTTAVGVVAFIHAAVVTNLMPTTGLTLPFMSVGRVSLLLSLFSAGVLVSIGRRRGRPARSR
jgi:cell division protein FtsW